LIGAGVVYAFGGGSLGSQVAAGAFHQAVGVLLFATLVVMALHGATARLGAVEVENVAGT